MVVVHVHALVFTQCTVQSLSTAHSAAVLVKSVFGLETILSLSPKLYAIHPNAPVAFHEGYQVLVRLAAKFWPGPMTIHVRIPPNTTTVPTSIQIQKEGYLYVSLESPSHPLMIRMLQELPISTMVISKPVVAKDGTFLTNANDVVQHYQDDANNTMNTTTTTTITTTTTRSMKPNKRILHVLQGEEKREMFTVPTCTFGNKPCSTIWINDDQRTVFIVGTRGDNDDGIDATMLRNLLWKETTKCRVVASVLRKYKVVDQRTGVGQEKFLG